MSTTPSDSTPQTDDQSARPRHARLVAMIVGAAAALTVASVVTATLLTGTPEKNPAVASTPATKESGDMATTIALPLADYQAVIPGLLSFTDTIDRPVEVGTLTIVSPVYGADRITPVARLDKTDFIGKPTPVVVVERAGAWSKILTPSRVSLPSKTDGNAPAQSAGWIRSNLITDLRKVPERVDVDLRAMTLTVTGKDGASQTFAVGIGAAGTPTPSAVSGYLEARYVDPKQGTGDHPIQLTSLHVQTEDEPVAGGVGGVVAMHYYDARDGAISHGCLRLSAEAVAAINALPMGSIVTVTP